MSTPSPAPDPVAQPDLLATDQVERTTTLEAPVDDGILLVDPVRVRAHALNATAAAVWRATEPASTIAAVVDAVAVATGAPAGAIDADVRRVLVALAAEGLIVLGSRPPPPIPTERPGPISLAGAGAGEPATSGPDAGRGDGLEAIGPFRGLDVTFDLATADAELARALAEVWAPLHAPAATGAATVHHYRIVRVEGPAQPRDTVTGTRELSLDGVVLARVASDSAVLAHAVWHANQLVSTASERFLQLHAAGLVIDGRGVLLPAEMNSGKSTLATALVEAGASYLTDETVALDLRSARAVPYPKAITLDPGSWSHFARLEPPFLLDQPGLAHAKWYVQPDAVRPGAAIAPRGDADGKAVADIDVATIVFPTYAPDRPTAIERLDPVAAAAELSRNAFNLVAVGQPGVDLIARLASTVPCWSLSTADVASAVAAIADAARA